MKIGVFADVHDHVDNLRRTIVVFNHEQCDLVLFAGDFVSPLVIPPLRKLSCPLIACLGDNDGNYIGIAGGMRVVGTLAYGPFCSKLNDGTQIVVSHQLSDIRHHLGGAHIVVWAHTHRASVTRDRQNRLMVNPGETSGWVTRQPTVAIIDTAQRDARIVNLPELGEPPVIEPF